MSQYKNLDWQLPGIGDVPSYQVSGVPYLTSSTAPSTQAIVTINFPYVTQWVHVRNLDNVAHLRLGFSNNGVSGSGTNYILLEDHNKANSDIYLNVKCTSIYLQSNTAANINFSVAAGLTFIPTNELPGGVNWSGSVGVG